MLNQCYSKENKNSNCPVCQEWLNILALPLPYAHCSQSRLVCAISGLPLNENNQPMVLPNGYVYGEQVIIGPFFNTSVREARFCALVNKLGFCALVHKIKILRTSALIIILCAQ